MSHDGGEFDLGMNDTSSIADIMRLPFGLDMIQFWSWAIKSRVQ